MSLLIPCAGADRGRRGCHHLRGSGLIPLPSGSVQEIAWSRAHPAGRRGTPPACCPSSGCRAAYRLRERRGTPPPIPPRRRGRWLTHYIGKVLPNGHLEIPKTVVESMDLKDGDEVVVALHKVTVAGVSVPAGIQTIVQELVGTPSNLQEIVEAFTTIPTKMMPQKQQRRLSRLLWKNQDGTITAKEEAELDTLVKARMPAPLVSWTEKRPAR